MITQKELKQQLHYNPETGLFTWIIAKQRIKIRAVAGCLSNSTGYVQLNINGGNYLAHRLAFLYMTGKFPEVDTDHINHTKNDNSWVNLREVTKLENSRNKPKHRNNKSGVVGVCWNKRSGKWLSYIYVNYKRIDLGLFLIKQDAILKRQKAEVDYSFHLNNGVVL